MTDCLACNWRTHDWKAGMRGKGTTRKGITGRGTTSGVPYVPQTIATLAAGVYSRSRTPVRMLLRRLSPLLRPARENWLTIFGQYPALLNQIVHRFRITNDVLFMAAVAFFNRTSGSAVFWRCAAVLGNGMYESSNDTADPAPRSRDRVNSSSHKLPRARLSQADALRRVRSHPHRLAAPEPGRPRQLLGAG